MGKYKGAIITTSGQNLIAEAIAGTDIVTFTELQTSSHQYPSTTNFQALTSLDDVEQSVSVSSVTVFDGNILQVQANVPNTGVTADYLIQTLGIFAKLGDNTPVLVAVIVATDPDEMPAEDPASPSSFLYNIQMLISNADQINVTVNPAAAVTVAQMEAALAYKLDKVNIGPSEPLNVATQDYTEGEYLVYNGKVYIVTAAIATGDTLTPGTNVEETTVGAEVKKARDAASQPNLLDNSYFCNPINQRQSDFSGGYPSTSLPQIDNYAADRWYISVTQPYNAGVKTYFNSNGMTVELPPGQKRQILIQAFEFPGILPGKKVSFSVRYRMRGSTERGMAYIYLTNNSVSPVQGRIAKWFDFVPDGEWHIAKGTIKIPDSAEFAFDTAQLMGFHFGTRLDAEPLTWLAGAPLQVYNINETTYFDISWAKVEIADEPTPYEIPSFSTELLKCQRYFFKSHQTSIVPGYTDQSGFGIGAIFFLPVQMRITPVGSAVMASIALNGNYYENINIPLRVWLSSANAILLYNTSRPATIGPQMMGKANLNAFSLSADLY